MNPCGERVIADSHCTNLLLLWLLRRGVHFFASQPPPMVAKGAALAVAEHMVVLPP